jgi:hypothetical protein
VAVIDGCRAWTTLGALGAALLAHGRLSPFAPVLTPAFPASPMRDERSRASRRSCRDGALLRLHWHNSGP